MGQRYYSRKKKRRIRARFYVILGVLFVALAVCIALIIKAGSDDNSAKLPPGQSPGQSAGVQSPGDEATPTAPPTPTPVPDISQDVVPTATENTKPEKFEITTGIQNDGNEVSSYKREQNISFGKGYEYTELEGVITFRGNNYRDAASYGTADIKEEKLELIIAKQTSGIGNWRGAGWTGQPLIVKWPAELRQKMTSIYDEFRNKEDFTEVIYATLDGRIYFMELETGAKTRDFITIGAPTKGTASIDPRGYPIIYVGQGLQEDGSASGAAHMYVRAFSLIDGKLLMKFGAASKDPFAYRNWQAYDSSPLIDAATDTLIAPGENGIIYTCKLNTKYNAETGEVSMDMDPVKVKYRYTSPINKKADNNGRWGIENSAVAWREYLMFTDNAGLLQCVNLNTMELVYANNLTDDSDVTMVLEEDIPSNTFYLYAGCEYDPLVRKGLGNSAPVYARKLDGVTGEIMWETEFTARAGGVDGGILASPVLGKEGTNMDGLIIYNMSQEVKGDTTTSRVVALDKHTGKQVWDYDMKVSGWSPSSPVPVYTEDGRGYIVQCDRAGDVALIDGETGEEVYNLNVGQNDNFEASPAVYGNTIVIGSRNANIFFIKIK
ncbi:MAG: PQQ-binding-like beta-propeller repeat protein [Christensenellales bacterium]|jgi:outer membrane protein assembly factor BamB